MQEDEYFFTDQAPALSELTPANKARTIRNIGELLAFYGCSEEIKPSKLGRAKKPNNRPPVQKKRKKKIA